MAMSTATRLAVVVLAACAAAVCAVPTLPPQLETVSYTTNEVNYTQHLYLDTETNMSREDNINYDDSSPQRLTTMYFCQDNSLVVYNIIFSGVDADPHQVNSCSYKTYSPSKDCGAIFAQRAGDSMSVAALINGINASSTCNCDSVPVGSTCGCNLSHQVTGPPCSGTDFVKWTLVKSTQYALPKAWADQQVVKVEGFCNAAGSSTQWAQADVSSAAVIKAAITGLINAMPKGTCYSDGP